MITAFGVLWAALFLGEPCRPQSVPGRLPQPGPAQDGHETLAPVRDRSRRKAMHGNRQLMQNKYFAQLAGLSIL